MLVKLSDYTEFPGPRYIRLGPFSGEWFRDEVLVPAFRDHGSDVVINLDDTVGYGSSFLEEAFGGLIRAGIDEAVVFTVCEKIVSDDDESLPIEILGYVSDAVKARGAHD